MVLMARTVNEHLKQGGNPILNYNTVIPNSDPVRSLPGDFTILGAEVQDINMTSGEGTIYIEFEIPEPLAKQRGRQVFYHCTGDGRHQLRLWQSFSNRFRVDFVHPGFGRRNFEGDLNYLEINVKHRLAAGFSSEGIKVNVDGTELHQIEEQL